MAQKGTLVLGETKETLASQVRALLGVGAAGRPGGWAPLYTTISVQCLLRARLSSAYQHLGMGDVVAAIQVSQGQKCEIRAMRRGNILHRLAPGNRAARKSQKKKSEVTKLVLKRA